MTQARILIVDDDKSIALGLELYFQKAGFQTHTAFNGKMALQLLRQLKPELMVLDLMMPELDGWEVTRIVRQDASLANIPIIMLTARIEDSDKIKGLELGADDYVTKPFNPSEVVARAKALLRRSQGLLSPSQVLQVGQFRLELASRTFFVAGEEVHLTQTEFELFEVFMQYPNHTFTREELVEKALGYSYGGVDRTLDSHIKNLRRKLPEAHQAQLKTVYGVGYKLQVS